MSILFVFQRVDNNFSPGLRPLHAEFQPEAQFSLTVYCIFETSWSVSVCQQELDLWARVQPHHYALKGLVFPL